MTQPEMTASDARHFERYSVANAATVMHSRGCGCKPYVDVFTYQRWRAQGFQVQKGEKSIRIPTITRIEKTNKETGEIERFGRRHISFVFCRHQVKES